MSAQSKVIGRSPVLPSPGWIVIGYLVVLFAATAGVVIFPFSNIGLGLLFVVAGAFFVVAVPIIVIADLFLMIAAYRGLRALGRRLLLGAGHGSAIERASKSTLNQKYVEFQGTDMDLWDRWIDGLG
jgi:Na+/citrate or Na+/malate symporter